MKNFLTVSLLLLVLAIPNFAQQTDYELGTNLLDRYRGVTGFFDYSDPEAVNMKVNVWGYVRYPGKYVVPIYTSVTDLLSYAGGPTEAADLENLRLYKVGEDGTQKMLKFSFQDVMWEDQLYSRAKNLPPLEGGDILAVPGEPKLFFRDWLSVSFSLISTLVTVTLLILQITGN